MSNVKSGGRTAGSKNVNWQVLGPIVLRMIGKVKVPDIARKLGIAAPTLNAWLNREFSDTIERKIGRPVAINDFQKEQIKFLRQNDVSIKEIAMLYNVSVHTIYRVLKKNGNIELAEK